MSTISTGLAKKLVENYVINKVGEIIDPSDTRGVWFSKDELLKALNTPVHDTMPNGLRFYFGAYESYQPGRPPRFDKEENKITLVIIPTTYQYDDSGKIIMHPYREEALPFDLLTDPDADAGYDKEFKEANDGQICPPPRVIG